VQLSNRELSRTPLQRGRAPARQQRDHDSDALRELHRKPIAHVELFDLVPVADIDDPTVRPDAVDIGDDQADVGGGGHCGAS
jgi:hypothetical protein